MHLTIAAAQQHASLLTGAMPIPATIVLISAAIWAGHRWGSATALGRLGRAERRTRTNNMRNLRRR